MTSLRVSVLKEQEVLTLGVLSRWGRLWDLVLSSTQQASVAGTHAHILNPKKASGMGGLTSSPQKLDAPVPRLLGLTS